MVKFEDDRVRYIVHYGDTSAVTAAHARDDALEIICNEYEATWGLGAFDQYNPKVEVEDPVAVTCVVDPAYRIIFRSRRVHGTIASSIFPDFSALLRRTFCLHSSEKESIITAVDGYQR